jgi:hypothetical protein
VQPDRYGGDLQSISTDHLQYTKNLIKSHGPIAGRIICDFRLPGSRVFSFPGFIPRKRYCNCTNGATDGTPFELTMNSM